MKDCSPTGIKPDGTKAQVGLNNQVRMWPTPDSALMNDGADPEKHRARQERLRETHRNGNGAGTPLAMAVKMWPTPTTRDHKDTGSLENVPENALLGRVAANWSTPRSTDGEKGGPNQIFGAGGVLLPAQAAQWPTPTSLSFGGSHQPGNSRSYNETMRLASSLPDLTTYQVGGNVSPERRSLNPAFVEWLMGWPLGWTLVASTDLGCSATALSLWRQRMRSELSRIGTPPSAIPAQISLFG